jgi:hypothetical protein
VLEAGAAWLQEAAMGDLHWTVGFIPVVVIGAVLVGYFLSKHKEKKSTEHIFKL